MPTTHEPGYLRGFSAAAVRAALAGLLVLSACGDGGVLTTDEDASAAGLLDDAARALGGPAALLAITNERIVSHGLRRSSGDALTYGTTIPMSEFDYALTAEMANDQSRHEVTNRTVDFIVPRALSYVEVVNGTVGYVRGNDYIFNFAPPPVPDRGIASSQIASRRRHTDLISPWRVLRRAIVQPWIARRDADVEADGRVHRVIRVREAGAPPVRLFLDAATNLPSRIEVIEDHPPLGDTLVRAAYSDFRNVGSVKFPHRVTIEVGGLLVHDETRSLIATNVTTPPDFYTVPEAVGRPFVREHADFAARSSEWLQAYEYIGLSATHYEVQQGRPVDLVPVAGSPGVRHVVGESYNSLLVEQSDGLVLVDTAFYEERQADVLAAIKQAFPSKPIKAIVATHFHFDHSGGIREAAAGAASNVTVYAGTPSVPFFKAVFKHPHTVDPDRLSKAPRSVRVQGVGGTLTLSDPLREVQIHLIANTHAEGMLAVYVPQEKVLFNADLYSPRDAAKGQPISPPGTRRTWAAELYDEIIRLGLDVATVVGAHGDSSTSTREDLRIAAVK